MPKMNIKKGDLVQVLSGKDKGKQANVLRAFPSEGKVLVEGVAIVKKATRPTQQNQQGGIVSQEAKIDASNVALVCPKCGQPTRVGHAVNGEGKKVRVCKKCGEQF
ncbi:MAG: 50S ribosomal protein L24 [Atopobiaceae bacterium]|nr:50S ribosomal protein L24 [Olsenella sp.]MBQ6491619.1 50S ribosomal protein L24 [Atopobiaceae bacterium]